MGSSGGTSVTYRSIRVAAVAMMLAAFPACSAGSLFNASPVPVGLSVSGSAPAVGHTSQLKAVAQMSDGSAQDVTSLTAWSSSDTTIATVTPSGGLMTAVASGAVTITGTYQGYTSTELLVVP